MTVGNLQDVISDCLERVKRYTFVFPAAEAETTMSWLLKSMSGFIYFEHGLNY